MRCWGWQVHCLPCPFVLSPAVLTWASVVVFSSHACGLPGHFLCLREPSPPWREIGIFYYGAVLCKAWIVSKGRSGWQRAGNISCSVYEIAWPWGGLQPDITDCNTGEPLKGSVKAPISVPTFSVAHSSHWPPSSPAQSTPLFEQGSTKPCCILIYPCRWHSSPRLTQTSL